MLLSYKAVYDRNNIFYRNSLAFATKGSACFDLRAYLGEGVQKIKMYSSGNKEEEFPIDKWVESDPSSNHTVDIPSGYRALIPTGYKFDIPEGYHMKVYPRSSTGLKLGLTLPNSVGIIDSDYVEQVHLILLNTTQKSVTIQHGERYSQAELVQNVHTTLCEVSHEIERKTDRSGGFGSTGTK